MNLIVTCYQKNVFCVNGTLLYLYGEKQDISSHFTVKYW